MSKFSEAQKVITFSFLGPRVLVLEDFLTKL